MIEIKAWFSGWRQATKEQAAEFARYLFWKMTMLTDEQKIQHINEKHLRGISFALADMGGHYGNNIRT